MPPRNRRPKPAEPAPDAPVGAPVTEAVAAPESEPERAIPRAKLYGLILFVFLCINGAVLFLLRGVDTELQWSKELRVADDAFSAGRNEEAVKLLAAFGDHWPDARKTFGFNEKSGRYLAAVGDWKGAAEHYEIAAKLRPETPDIHASAGEAQWQAGNRDRAFELFKDEILEGNSDNDLANVRLGQHFVAQKDFARAFEFFQAVRDRGKYTAELVAAREELDVEVLAPARAASGLDNLTSTQNES